MVPLDVVGTAAFSALMEFDAYISQLSPKKQHLRNINFVNIDKTVTENLMSIFNLLLRNSSQHMPPANFVPPESPSGSKATSNDDSSTEHKVLKPKVSSPRNACCVCGKTDNSGNKFVYQTSCSHRCCIKCRHEPCKKCLSLSQAVAHSRKPVECQISPRSVDSRAQNNDGTVTVHIGATALPSQSPTSRARSNSFSVCSSKSSAIVAAVDSSSTETGDSNSMPADSDQVDDEFAGKSVHRRSTSLTRDGSEKCVICMDKITNPKKLDCGHTFCADCIDAAFTHAAKCPCCGRIFGKLRGNQPSGGTMKVRRSSEDLAGYRGLGSLVIEYEILSGFQQVRCNFYYLLIKAFGQVC